MHGSVAKPTANQLFTIRETAVNLDSIQSEVNLDSIQSEFFIIIIFHHHVAKLLLLCKQARPDIQVASAFLCARVKAQDIGIYSQEKHFV